MAGLRAGRLWPRLGREDIPPKSGALLWLVEEWPLGPLPREERLELE